MRELYVPDGSAMIGAFEAGRQARHQREAMADEQRRREAARSIGSAMATGDYSTAARLALETGDLGTGLKLQEADQSAKATARKRDILTRSRTDPKAAQDAALEAGDFDLYEDLKGLTDEAEKTRYAQFAAVLRAIGSEEPDRWDDLIVANRGQLESLGIAPTEIDAFVQASPEQRRGMMAVMLQRADQFDKFQTERHQDREFTATQEERARDNRRADQQLAISRQNAGISAANLAQRKAEHAARESQGGYGLGAPRVLGPTLPEGY